jgi:hypothetical protein
VVSKTQGVTPGRMVGRTVQKHNVPSVIDRMGHKNALHVMIYENKYFEKNKQIVKM